MTIPIQIRKLAYRSCRGPEIASHDHGFSAILRRKSRALRALTEIIYFKNQESVKGENFLDLTNA
jgi:hypothetical protein